MEEHSIREPVHVTVQMAMLELPVEVSAPQHEVQVIQHDCSLPGTIQEK